VVSAGRSRSGASILVSCPWPHGDHLANLGQPESARIYWPPLPAAAPMYGVLTGKNMLDMRVVIVARTTSASTTTRPYEKKAL
jgi:hypothetical protein